MGYIFCRWQYGIQWIRHALGSERCYVVWNHAQWRPRGRSRSLKVTDFGTDRNPVRDFLLLNNASLSSTVSKLARRFGQIIAFDRGSLYLTPSFEVIRWTLDYEIWSRQKPETSLYRVVHKIFRYIELFSRGSPVTCGRRDRITIATACA